MVYELGNMNTEEKLIIFKDLLNKTGISELALEVTSNVKMRKTNNPFIDMDIRKKSVSKLKINTSYTSSVNEQRNLEGKPPTFEPSGSWHNNIFTGTNGTIAVNRNSTEENRKYYITGVVEGTDHLGYLVDGNIAEKDIVSQIKAYVPEHKVYKSKTQDLEEDVQFRIFDLNNIQRVIVSENVL